MNNYSLPLLSPEKVRMLIERIETIPLYAHAFSFHLNFRAGGFQPCDLLDFAATNHLRGIKIHSDDGGNDSLGNANAFGLAKFRNRANNLGLDVHLEISETEVTRLREAIRIGSEIGATSIRCYPRYEGTVSSVIQRTIDDLRHLNELDPDGRFRFTLEQHEDLTSEELVSIIETVDNPNLSILFDFTNMINAYERPFEAFNTMATHISDVHIKDAVFIKDRGGWGQQCCRSGEGDIPQAGLLLELLCLGDGDTPQVLAYGLEEEDGYYSGPFRFPDEDTDPYIVYRDISETNVSKSDNTIEKLSKERADAQRQCEHIQELLKQLRIHAIHSLEVAT